MPSLPGWLRPPADRFLTYLAHADSPVAGLVTAVLARLFPRAAARVKFREGNFLAALTYAERALDAPQVARVRDMAGVLQRPLPAPVAPRCPRGTFRGRVLQVLHSSASFDQNGYATRTEQLVQALAEANIASSLVTRLGYPWDLLQHRRLPTDFHDSSANGLSYRHRLDPAFLIGGVESAYVEAYAAWIAEQADADGVDVLHAHSNYLNGLAAARAGVLTGLPVVYEMRGLWHRTRGLAQPRYRRTDHYDYCERQELTAAMQADQVVAISAPLARWLEGQGVPGGKITVVGNASARHEPVSPATGAFTIGYAGSFVGYEGLDLLLRALPLVREAVPDARLLLVGDGVEVPRLRKLARRLRIADAVEFTGRVTREVVRVQYRRMHVAVVPRYANEVTELVPPLKPMELMAMGVPYVASNVPPLAAVTRDGENGLLFSAGDVPSLAAALVKLGAGRVASSPTTRPLLATLREGGLRWAAEHAWHDNAQRYAAVYARFFEEG